MSSSSSSSDEEPVSVLEQLSPFSGSGGDLSEVIRSLKNIQDELLVDISDIQPAGDNKDLFSIDEESREGTPSKSSSEFHVVELTDENLASCSEPPSHDLHGEGQLPNHHPFNPTLTGPGVGPFPPPPPLTRRRSSDGGSGTSEVGGLFPIYEVPGVSFTAPPQSDLESCGSEWEDGGSGSPLEKLSKDTVYQGFQRMRQRYHKYKGRYADLLRVFREKERETEKLREVLTKQQDRAVRRMSELREQCALEQQAKAHLEQELRSDLEEKDHKIEALQTKVRLLQEGCFGDGPLKSLTSSSDGGTKWPHDDGGGGSGAPSLQGELTTVGKGHSHEDFDTVSVGSLGSISMAPPSLESEELIEKLREDLTKHKALLARCMENIRSNKERIASLLQERDAAQSQLQEKGRAIDTLKADHERMLESLRATVESSALSMAETKQQLFEELQTKEAEVERYREGNLRLQKELDRLHEDDSRRAAAPCEEDTEIDLTDASQELRTEVAMVRDLETKCTELENLVADLQDSKKHLELKLERVRGAPDGGQVALNDLREECAPPERKEEKLVPVPREMRGTSEASRKTEEGGSSFAKRIDEDQRRRMTQKAVTQTIPEVEQEEMEQLTAELRSLNEENESLNAEVSSLNDENEALHGEFQCLRKEHEDLQARWRAEIEKWKEREARSKDDLQEAMTTFEVTLRKEEDARERLEKTVEAMQEEKRAWQEGRTTLENEKRRLEGVISLLESEKGERKESKARLEREKERLQKDEEELKEEKTRLEGARETLENEKRALEETIAFLENERKELVEAQTNLSSEKEKLEAESAVLEEARTRLEQEKGGLLKDKERLGQERTNLQNEKEELGKRRERLESERWEDGKERKALQDERGKLEKRREALEKEKRDLGKERERLENERGDIGRQRKTLEDERGNIDRERKMLEDERRKVSKERERLENEREELGKKRGALEKEKAKTDAENETLRERLKEKEDKVQNLEDQLKKVVDQLVSSNTLSMDRDLMIVSLKSKLENLEAEMTCLTESQKEADRALRESDGFRMQLEENLKETEDKLLREAENKVVLENTVRAIEASFENMDNLSAEEDNIHSRIEALVSNKVTLEGKVQNLSGQVQRLEEQLALRATVLERHNIALREADGEKDLLTAALRQLEDEGREASSKNEELRQSLEDSSRHLALTHLRLSEGEAVTSGLRSTLAESEARNAALESEVAALSGSVEATKKDAERRIEEAVEALRTQMEADLESKSRVADALAQSLDQLKGEAARLEDEILRLRTLLSEAGMENEDLSATFERKLEDAQQRTKEKEAEWILEAERYSSRMKELARKETEAEDRLQEALREKDELEKMVGDAEAKVSQLEEIHVKKAQQVEDEWQKKIRLQYLSDSFLIASRSLTLCNMMRVSCELERLQAEQDQCLLEVSSATSAAEDGLRRVLDRKDAELARLMDAKEAAEALLEELREELLRRDEERCRLESEAEELRGQVAATEKQVQEVEASNADLRQRIEDLQSELDCIERLAKEGPSVQELVTKETQRREEEMQLQISSLTQKIAEMEKAEKTSVVQVSLLEKDKEALRKEVEVQVTFCKELQHELELLKVETESTATRLLEKLEEERSRNAILLQESESWGVEKEALVSEVNIVKAERTSLCSDLERIRNSVEALTTQTKALSDQLKQQEELNDRLKLSSGPQAQPTSRKDFIATLEAELEPERSQLVSLKDALQGFLEEYLHTTMTEDVDIRKVLGAARNDKKALLQHVEDAEAERMQLKLDLAEGEEDLKRRDDILKAKEQQIKRLTKDLKEAKDRIEALSSEAEDTVPDETVVISSNPETGQNGNEKQAEKDVEATVSAREEEHAECATKLHALKTQLEGERELWRARVVKGVRQKEGEMRLQLEALTTQWNAEKKELERLARMAADAFRSGTDSVDLLKEQVTAQRAEIDELRRSHKREVGELQALLEVKRRRGKGTPRGEIRGGGALEEAAEFEYLKNILYQYMMGKETETLSKVLCAVVKFSKDQQRQIIEAEDRKQNLLREARWRRTIDSRKKASRES